MKRLRKDDLVVVTTGKDRGSRGRILKVLEEQDRVIVEGVNVMKRHMKPTQQNPNGGIIEKENPIHISNVMPLDTKADKATRVRIKVDGDGKKVRVATRSGATLG